MNLRTVRFPDFEIQLLSIKPSRLEIDWLQRQFSFLSSVTYINVHEKDKLGNMTNKLEWSIFYMFLLVWPEKGLENPMVLLEDFFKGQCPDPKVAEMNGRGNRVLLAGQKCPYFFPKKLNDTFIAGSSNVMSWSINGWMTWSVHLLFTL